MDDLIRIAALVGLIALIVLALRFFNDRLDSGAERVRILAALLLLVPCGAASARALRRWRRGRSAARKRSWAGTAIAAPGTSSAIRDRGGSRSQGR